MQIVRILLVAALLVGISNVALASPDRDHHDHQRSSHYERGHSPHWREPRHDRWQHRNHDHYRRPVVVRHGYAPRYAAPHHHWRRGYRYAGPTYVVRDYGYYRLRRPPHGYRWVRADDNNYLLVAMATGLILDIAMR